MFAFELFSPREIASMEVLDVGEVERLKLFHRFATAIAACAVNEHRFFEIEHGDLRSKFRVAEGDVLRVRESSATELSGGANVEDLCLGICLQPGPRFSSGEIVAKFS